MTTQLKTILASHVAWVRKEEGGKRADLSGANLVGADLSDAYLRYAVLRGADLHDANLSSANLSETSGIRHVSIAADWHGECGRKILAVDHGVKEGVVIHCGCFRGGWDDLDRWIEEHDECERVTASRRAVTAMLRVLWDARGEYA